MYYSTVHFMRLTLLPPCPQCYSPEVDLICCHHFITDMFNYTDFDQNWLRNKLNISHYSEGLRWEFDSAHIGNMKCLSLGQFINWPSITLFDSRRNISQHTLCSVLFGYTMTPTIYTNISRILQITQNWKQHSHDKSSTLFNTLTIQF